MRERNVDLHRACGVDSVELTRLAALSTFDPSSFSPTLQHSPHSLSLSLSNREALFRSLSLVTRWLRRPCRTLNLSPRNSLILSTVPDFKVRFQASALSSSFSLYLLSSSKEEGIFVCLVCLFTFSFHFDS